MDSFFLTKICFQNPKTEWMKVNILTRSRLIEIEAIVLILFYCGLLEAHLLLELFHFVDLLWVDECLVSLLVRELIDKTFAND